MNTQSIPQGAFAQDAALAAYWLDLLWRAVETADTLRQRAANMAEHEAAGMPPLLHFESEQIADGHDLEPPCNYRLLRVTRCGSDALERHVRKGAAPVMVVDPRAGHGPGIGGFKRDSEVGMALLEGHPVYFVVFDPEPAEGQTLGAVVRTLAVFIDLLAARHRNQRPIVYGNCQGGWALMLALSHCRHRAALAVLNGSPLSYWAGERGVNPMRLLGGFTGGTWPAHWLSDLGGGTFDGAWLVQNFEALRPEGVFRKYDTLFAQPGLERERFLEFERWWNGFYFLGGQEMLAIARDLFVGNLLEDGKVVVDEHCHADLTSVRTPLVIFSSYGDNITPPHQALGWLPAIYPSTEALVAAGQRIVFLTHREVGHLGIFVSADVARREHRAILHHAQSIERLAPGLYQMLLEDAPSAEAAPRARFEARRVEDLQFDPAPAGFDNVKAVSDGLERIYAQWVSPAVKAVMRPEIARPWRAAHPMRASRMLWSERAVPALAWLPWASDCLERLGAADPKRANNPWYRLERAGADAVAQAWTSWRTLRDLWAEWTFEQTYAVWPSFQVGRDGAILNKASSTPSHSCGHQSHECQ
ncbi:Poly(3-hydroxyalkanoate) synthetase [Variovorax sp. HW608]|uniref:DUF3141 domain-containing protein n=1 Tax=Variovorax sp. HW608 TaxID=1034889 RepID=UPI00081FAB3C|nr:DUF3141 domain-containing protein [Variovorax sp. HW608]SCK20491.1 Poly(3-hydroxyalkanoate) synthetase [Variovorax sp. HW608]